MEKLSDFNARYFKKNRIPNFAKTVKNISSNERVKQLELAEIIYKVEIALKDNLSEDLFEETKIKSYKNNILYLAVNNSVIAQELKFYKDILLEELKGKKINVEDIKIVLAQHNELY